MLSAAVDIIHKQESHEKFPKDLNRNNSLNASKCQEDLGKPRCDMMMSTGAVLIADVLPSFLLKPICALFMQRVPFGLRHFLVCSLQSISFLVVAFSSSVTMSLIGVVFASAGTGIGEVSYLALTSHYKMSSVAAWSSGTGGAGIVGSFAYAALTEPKLFGFSPRVALLTMLIVPAIFAIAYWLLLVPSEAVHRMQILSPTTWIVPKTPIPIHPTNGSNGHLTTKTSNHLAFGKKLRLIIPLLRFMLPMSLVYLAEYLINSGLHQLIHFDCSHGLRLSGASQFRWYQFLYQFGVFISRSSVTWLQLSSIALYILPLLQFGNVAIFYLQALFHFLPHIGIIFALIFVEGLFGGTSYVNTFNKIHKKTPPEVREFSLSFATCGDSLGVSIAGFVSILVHNQICKLYPTIYP